MAPSDDAKAANGSAPADAEAEEVEARPPYLSYMHSIYAAGIIAQQLPIVTTDPTLLAEAARKAMTPTAFNYVAGGAGEGSTMDANRLAFRQWKLMGRFLQPQMPSDMGVTLFGKKYGRFRFRLPNAVGWCWRRPCNVPIGADKLPQNAPSSWRPLACRASSTPIRRRGWLR